MFFISRQSVTIQFSSLRSINKFQSDVILLTYKKMQKIRSRESLSFCVVMRISEFNLFPFREGNKCNKLANLERKSMYENFPFPFISFVQLDYVTEWKSTSEYRKSNSAPHRKK